jgi:hypothetical protein
VGVSSCCGKGWEWACLLADSHHDAGAVVLEAGLPRVDGAVAAREGVRLGVLEGVQDGLVLGVVGNTAMETSQVRQCDLVQFMLITYNRF